MWGGGGILLDLLPGRSHGRHLLAGQGLEGLGNEVGMAGHHLFPADCLHHVGHVTGVDKFDALKKELRIKQYLTERNDVYKFLKRDLL